MSVKLVPIPAYRYLDPPLACGYCFAHGPWQRRDGFLICPGCQANQPDRKIA